MASEWFLAFVARFPVMDGGGIFGSRRDGEGKFPDKK